ncbi:hypothetical protein ACU635_50895 [[Actinomadura] parvosata]|uniref:hypothetical protein n=1 Tax=[Actinomadura] parvosata TaxID=1955412 RepID=UPI00406CEBB2
MIRILRLVVIGFVVASVVWFMFSRPESAAAAVRAVIGVAAGAVDAGARFLEGVTRG